MKINKHGSFYIRNGWPTKILAAVRADPRIFSPNSEIKAVDQLGMGRVMIRSLRYWAKAMGLIVEDKDHQGLYCKETSLFVELLNSDPYLQDKGSLWLLHRELATNKEEATAWYWSFNEFYGTSFSKAEFVDAFYAYIINQGGTYNKSAIEKEFDCLKNTYLSDRVFDVKRIMDENTIPFFAPLMLIKSEGNGRYQKQKMNAKSIPLDIFYICLIKDNEDHLNKSRQVGLDHLLGDPGQVGKYFSLSYSVLIEILQMLENQGGLKLINNFGNRYIELRTSDCQVLLHDYYCNRGVK
jgi:hypothetical protein